MARRGTQQKFRRSAAALFAALIAVPVVGIVAPRPAHATATGLSGRIAFTSDLDGRTEIYTVDADGTGLTELTDFQGAGDPAWSPDGTHIAFEGGPDPAGIYTMDSAGRNVHRVTDGSFGVAWSGDGKKLAFTRAVNSSPHIFTVNLDGTGAQDVASDGTSPAWSPDGTKIAFRGLGGITLMNADGTNKTQLTSVPGEDHPSFSPDGTKIAFDTNRDGTGAQIWVMGAQGSNQTALTTTAPQKRFPRWSPDGNVLAVQTFDSSGTQLAAMDANGGNLHTILSNGSFLDAPDWQPLPKPKPPYNGRVAFVRFSGGNAEIYSADPDGTGVTDLTNDPAQDMSAAWSPDGTKLVFGSDRAPGRGLYVMNSDGTNPHLLLLEPKLWGIGLGWSGSKIVYAVGSNHPGGDTDIWTVNADGSGPTAILTDVSQERFPAWSPDGTKLVFTRTGTPSAGLWIANADGTGQIRLTDDTAGIDQAAGFSPDGTKIIFNRAAPSPNSSTVSQLWLMNTDGSGQAALTALPGYNAWPRYSPDGTEIVFQQSTADSNGPFDIIVMRADGSAPRTIAPSATDEEFPEWQPLLQPLPPGASSAVTATPGHAWAKVSWAPPTYDGGVALDGYTVTASPGGASVTVPADETTATVPGLANGTSYTFAVTAINSAGTGPPSTPSNAVTPFAPFRGRIAFASDRTGTSQIFTANPDRTGVLQLTHDPAPSSMPSWSPDGTRIAFDGGPAPQGVYVMNQDGSNVHRVSGDPALFIAWSPDGAKLAYIRQGSAPGVIDIATVNIDGTEERHLGTGVAPAWTPDSRHIVFRNNHQIWIMHADGTGRTPLTSTGPNANDSEPSVSPDGSKVAFTSNRDGNSELYVMDVHGANQTRLTTTQTTNEEWPRWAPDGSRIVFQRTPTGSSSYDLAVMNANGSGVQPVATSPANEEFPDWQGLAQAPNPQVPRVVDTAGVVVDDWGGLHTYTEQATSGCSTSGQPCALPTISGGPYWPGQDVVRGVTAARGGGGLVVDDWGGLHPVRFNGVALSGLPHGGPYWPGQDVVRGAALLADGSGGYVVDDWGGLHAFGVGTHPAPATPNHASYWPGQDVVRGVVLTADGTGGYTLDLWGGVHPFGIGASSPPAPPSGGPYWVGRDAARGITMLADGSGGFIGDSWGGLHGFDLSGQAIPRGPANGPYWPGQNVAWGPATVTPAGP